MPTLPSCPACRTALQPSWVACPNCGLQVHDLSAAARGVMGGAGEAPYLCESCGAGVYEDQLHCPGCQQPIAWAESLGGPTTRGRARQPNPGRTKKRLAPRPMATTRTLRPEPRTPGGPAPGYAPALAPVIIIQQPKSAGLALLLTLLFGPLGMLYSTVGGALLMLMASAALFFVLGPFAGCLVWPICLIWAVGATGSSRRVPSM
jgi:hypothetical protein